MSRMLSVAMMRKGDNPNASTRSMMDREKPPQRRGTGIFGRSRAVSTKPQEAIWESTVARAAPATSRRGNGPRPKMSRGSRSRLTTAPMPWMHMGPTASPLAWSTRSPENCIHTPSEPAVTMARY